MALSDATLVAYSNTEARRLADRLASALNFLAPVVADFDSQGIAALVTDPTQTIDDGSGPDGDGRQQITGQDLLNVVAAAKAVVAALSDDQKASISLVAVNPNL